MAEFICHPTLILPKGPHLDILFLIFIHIYKQKDFLPVKRLTLSNSLALLALFIPVLKGQFDFHVLQTIRSLGKG